MTTHIAHRFLVYKQPNTFGTLRKSLRIGSSVSILHAKKQIMMTNNHYNKMRLCFAMQIFSNSTQKTRSTNWPLQFPNTNRNHSGGSGGGFALTRFVRIVPSSDEQTRTLVSNTVQRDDKRCLSALSEWV